MILETAIEEAIRRSSTFVGAQRRLLHMCEANVVEDLDHFYHVRSYIVKEHYRRRRHSKLRLVRRAS